MRDWDIVGGVALRQINGKQITVTPGRFGDIEAAIKDWEAKEALRQRRSVEELGELVDAALDRMLEKADVSRPVRRGRAKPTASDTVAPGARRSQLPARTPCDLQVE
ncbi:hypothetical protein ACFQX6_47845 [Streptosporangium lutulentum]